MKIALLNQKFDILTLWKLKIPILKCILHKKRLYNFLQVKLSEFLKKIDVSALPFQIMIEPTSRCNLKCPMCIRSQKKVIREEGDMSFEHFKNIIDELEHSIFFILLFNAGEPLMNKDIFRMISYAKDKNIFVIMSTNAYFLDDESAKKLINSGLDYLIISFDGATKETYEKIRKNSDFFRVVNNIKNLVLEKRKQKAVTPFINIQFIIMKQNEHEIDQMKILAKELNVDELQFKKVKIAKGREEILPEDERYKYTLYTGKGNTKRKNWCYRPWEYSVINWDGSVYPCCNSFAQIYNFGNIFTNGKFKKIWNNPLYKEFRKQILRDINSSEMCNTCPGTYKELLFID